MLIILKNEDGSKELIPYNTGKFALAFDNKPKSIIALDVDGNDIVKVKGKLEDGFYYIQPVPEAFSYLLKY